MLCDWDGYLVMVAVDILVTHKRYWWDQDESRFVVSGLLEQALVLAVKQGLVIVLLGYALGLIAVLITGWVLTEFRIRNDCTCMVVIMCIKCSGIIT